MSSQQQGVQGPLEHGSLVVLAQQGVAGAQQGTTPVGGRGRLLLLLLVLLLMMMMTWCLLLLMTHDEGW